MSVYVDGMRKVKPNPNWSYKRACHLTADSIEELHDFAENLGLKRAWFQAHATFPHYDLTESKRRQAVKLGAIEEPIVEAVKRLRAAVSDGGEDR